MKSALSTHCLAGLIAGTSIISLQAADWNGLIDTDYNKAGNWTPAGVPVGANAIVNINGPSVCTIGADIAAIPNDIIVGLGGGTNGRLDHTAGTANPLYWIYIGQATGTGIYNLADTTTPGGGISGFAQGTGTLNASGGEMHIGGWDAGSNGTLNINTTGGVTTGSWTSIGEGVGSVGVINLESGTFTVNNEYARFGLNGGTGTLNMSGGAFNKNGGNHFIIGDGTGGIGFANVSGGALTVGNEIWVGQNNGTGTFTFSDGTIDNGSWVAIGRDNGSGTFNMTGGTWTKTGESNFIVGASGPGTMTMSGGLVEVGPAGPGDRGITWIGETNNCTGELTISGTAEFNTELFWLGVNGGTTGTLNLDGGTVRTHRFIGGGGTDAVYFNGTQIIATAADNQFISGLDTASISAGGMLVDSAGFDLSVSQDLIGIGGVTKTGAGTLSLLGFNEYTGPNVVSGGKLILRADGLDTGDVSVADGAGFGVSVNFSGDQLTVANVSLGTTTDTTLDLNLGDLVGFLPSDSLLNVTGGLAVNGTVTVDVFGEQFATGDLQLISYDATQRTGGGTFVLDGLPNGVVASLVDDPDYYGPGMGLVYLDITSVALPSWAGELSDMTPDGTWDLNTTANWIDQVSLGYVTYDDPNPVLFDDLATGLTDVILDGTVMPSEVKFDNYLLPYTITGSGKISGPTGLLKQGTESLTITSLLNDYTGVTRLEGGGSLVVDTLADGGVASSIGAATSDPANLVVAGGTLTYTGATTTTDRGVTIAADASILATINDLTLGGPVVTNAGGLTKSGAGTLSLTGGGGNSIGAGVAHVSEGTLVIDGSVGGQTVNSGELWVADTPDVAANLMVTDTTLTLTSWLALSRGNGTTGQVSNVNFTNSTVTTANASTGYGNGIAFNLATTNLTVTNSSWTNNGQMILAESDGSTLNFTVNGGSTINSITGGHEGVRLCASPNTVCDMVIEDSTVNVNRFRMALGDNAMATLTIQGTGTLHKTTTGEWLSIGNSGANGTGTVTVKDNGSFLCDGADFNVSDIDTSVGVLNVQDNGSVSSGGTMFVGKGPGTNGTVNVSGGTFDCGGWVAVGRYGNTSVGTVNVTGGVFNHNGGGTQLIIGEEGQGTLTVSGTGVVNSYGTRISVAHRGTANGTVNIDSGGLLTAREVRENPDDVNSGYSKVNFDGGTLKAGADSGNFLEVDEAQVKAGGGTIDTDTFTVTVTENLFGAGSLTKTGSGTLWLNGTESYTGTTTVAAGTFGGNCSLAGPLVADAGTTLAPGTSVGTITAGNTTISGTYEYEIDGANGDLLTVNGDLDVSAATLNITELNPASAQLYVIANYSGTLTGPFAAVTGTIPAGLTLEYAYNGNSIALVGTLSEYDIWIQAFFPGETDPAVIGPVADPDGDGQPNNFEFLLGGDPSNNTDNAKIHTLIADSDADGDGDNELVLTVAVPTSLPAFAGSPSPAAVLAGNTCTIEGSTTLLTFAEPVSVVSPVTTGLPPAPAGYEYRSFSLDASNGVPSVGFMRAVVTP